MTDEMSSQIADSIVNTFGAGNVLFFVFAFLVVHYILTAYPLYKIYSVAGLESPGFAFIPVVGTLKLYNIANLSMLFVFVSLIPFVGAIATLILEIYVAYKLSEGFGLGIAGTIVYIFFAIPMLWYIAITKREFVGDINPAYLRDGF